MNEAIARLDLAGGAAAFALAFARAGGLVTFCPILGADILPARFRALLAACLAVVVLPLVPPLHAAGEGWAGLLAAILRELCVGLALGLAARAIFAGIEGAAQLVAGQSGFSLAAMVDPLSGEMSGATVLFQNMLAIALFLAADLHHVFVRALVDSYAILAPQAALPPAAGLPAGATALGATIFSITVRLAAPALVVTFAVDLVFVLVGRALPQVQILNVGYPAKMAAGIVALGVLVGSTGAAIGWIGRTFATDGAALLAALAGR